MPLTKHNLTINKATYELLCSMLCCATNSNVIVKINQTSIRNFIVNVSRDYNIKQLNRGHLQLLHAGRHDVLQEHFQSTEFAKETKSKFWYFEK